MAGVPAAPNNHLVANTACTKCGRGLRVYPYKLKSGRRLFCGKECVDAWQLGRRHSPSTEFKAGHVPATRTYPNNEAHALWKGDKVGYGALHTWVSRHKGRPTKCEVCGKVGGRIEWASIDRQYRRALGDFVAMCKSCHSKHDYDLCNSI